MDVNEGQLEDKWVVPEGSWPPWLAPGPPLGALGLNLCPLALPPGIVGFRPEAWAFLSSRFSFNRAFSIKNFEGWGHLAGSVAECATLNLRVGSSSPVLGVEVIKKNKQKNSFKDFKRQKY